MNQFLKHLDSAVSSLGAPQAAAKRAPKAPAADWGEDEPHSPASHAPQGPEAQNVPAVPQVATTERLISREAKYRAPESLVAEIQKKISRWHTHKAEQRRFSPAAALVAFRAQASEMQSAASAKPDSLQSRDGWSRADFVEDFATKAKAHHAICNELSAEIFELVKPEFARWAECANALADRIDSDDARLAAKFGIPHVPSNTVQTIRRVAAQVAARAGQFAPGNPEMFVSFVID